MYVFGRPLYGLCALALLQGFTCGVLAGGNKTVETVLITEEAQVESEIFSPSWMKQYSEGTPGCKLGRGGYKWRKCGLGSNLNSMLNVWVYVLVVQEWNDFSLICDGTQFQSLNCSSDSGGLVSQGWGCLFNSIPHMCIFDTAEAWTNHLLPANVSDEDLKTTAHLSFTTVHRSSGDIANSLQGMDINHLGALTVLTKYLWSYMTPWLRRDVNTVTHAEKAFERSPFLGMHVRRGDKLTVEAKAVPVEEYLKAAVGYFQEDTTPTGVDDIKAIWVASDDPDIVDEVRTLAPSYFPDVPSEAIVYAANGVEAGPITTGVDTKTRTQGYGSFVYILADLEQLAAAELFVGTFSSNVGRFVVLLREGLGKPRNSSISLDKAWHAGRQRSLLMD